MKLEYIVGVIILLFIVQFFYGLAVAPDSEFGGADGIVGDSISNSPSYEPWFEWAIFEPPGGETESLLFALQAAIGSLVIGYTFGYYKGKGKSS
jgi:cobalt/nickel transport protein